MTIDELEALARAAHREPWDYWSLASWQEGTGDQTGYWQPAPYTEYENAVLIAACSPERILALVAVARAADPLRHYWMRPGEDMATVPPHVADLRRLRDALDALDALP
jgi:hypothetical protein